MACKPSPSEIDADLSTLVSTTTIETNKLDTLQQLIKVNQASLDFALQPNIAENLTPPSEPIMVDHLANLSSEEKTQIERSVVDLKKEWNRHLAHSDELLESISSITTQIARLKNQIDQGQNHRKINPEIVTSLSASILELEGNLYQLKLATMNCQSRTLNFLSENTVLNKGATYLQSNTPML